MRILFNRYLRTDGNLLEPLVTTKYDFIDLDLIDALGFLLLGVIGGLVGTAFIKLLRELIYLKQRLRTRKAFKYCLHPVVYTGKSSVIILRLDSLNKLENNEFFESF